MNKLHGQCTVRFDSQHVVRSSAPADKYYFPVFSQIFDLVVIQMYALLEAHIASNCTSFTDWGSSSGTSSNKYRTA